MILQFLYLEYLTEETSEEISSSNTVAKLETKAQALKFMNEIYSVEPGVISETYILKAMSLSDIFAEILKHSTYFHNKTLNSFNSFCGKNDLKFLSSNKSVNKRIKNTNGSYVRYWNLYVLDNKYQDNVLQNIVQYDKFQEFIQEQKKNGFKIIGYARKSPGEKDTEKRARLLRTMIDKLKSRSLIQKVFVSECSSANDPLHKRDAGQVGFEGADGSTKDMLEFLKVSESKVILVTLDYAGLSTNVEDLKEFLREYESVEKVVADRLPVKPEMEIFNRETLLLDEDAISKFDCRKRSVQRSL
ncbi:hypothetical protein G6F17_012265 [Rhizopus arrhizus]|nr:hypothetical protein G6F17_012265 [Rhizopus arrhizus]KAG1092632.1 hypothetical protein G6F42_019153 [Rhizopus arrhizus]